MKVFRWGVCVVVAACLAFTATGRRRPKKQPAAQECAGRGVPVNKISIQLWTFAEYIGFGTDAATIARTEEVFRRLSEMGYRNVEPFTLSGLTAEQYRALLDKYGLKASARHVTSARRRARSTSIRSWPTTRSWGSSTSGPAARPDLPATEAEWVAYAEYLNELGERARKAGPDADGAQPQHRVRAHVSAAGRRSTS